jgi:hypothetical protein
LSSGACGRDQMAPDNNRPIRKIKNKNKNTVEAFIQLIYFIKTIGGFSAYTR